MNTNEIDKIYIGSSEVTKLYNGNTLVWDRDFETAPYFQDDFNGESLDSDKWYLDLGVGQSGWGNNQLEYNSRESGNINISGGKLNITAIKENYRGMGYTSARLRTINNWFRYGRLEIRAKLPTIGGMWPAVFLFGNTYTYTDYSNWPEAGEIDIIEVNGNVPTTAHTSVHTGYYNYNTGRPRHKQTTISNIGTEFKDYRIDWTPDYIRWFIDGVQVYEFLNDHLNHSRWPFDDPAFLILTLGVGGQFVGTIDDGALPQTMEVEHVRYFRMKDHLSVPQPTIPVPIPTPEHQEVLENGIVTASCENVPGYTIQWWAFGSMLGTGTTLSWDTVGVPLGTYNIECVAVDGEGNIGMSSTITYRVVEPIVSLPTPTSGSDIYNIPLGGTQVITLTNVPEGAVGEWYYGGPAGTGANLGTSNSITLEPPNTNNPTTASLYVRYVEGLNISDYYVITVNIS